MSADAKQTLTELLVLEAQQGDEAAFRRLHALWSADLRRMALRRVERDAAADEVMTDVWLAIARGLARLDDPACFPRWAFRIVERRSQDWVRRAVRERRRGALAAAEADVLAPAPAVADEPPEAVVALRATIARLPADQRELLHWHYGLGRSVAEIAEILSIPAGTVKSRLFAARETLKLKLENTSHEKPR